MKKKPNAPFILGRRKYFIKRMNLTEIKPNAIKGSHSFAGGRKFDIQISLLLNLLFFEVGEVLGISFFLFWFGFYSAQRHKIL